MSCGYPVSLAPEVEQNLLNFSMGINYKFNGKLNHNVDRVWLVTKFKLPKIEELYFPTLKFDGNCTGLRKILQDPEFSSEVKDLYGEHALKELFVYFCKALRPLVDLVRKKESYYLYRINEILKRDIPQALEKAQEKTLRSKRALLPAILPALSGLATIAIESLSSYLSGKRNKAMAKGLNEMRHLRKEDLNKLNELKNDFLLYGQYSSENIDKIVQTIRGLQNKTSKVEEVLMGMHREWPQLFMKTGAGLSIFGFHLNIFLHSIQEKHDRMYETLLSKLKDFLVAVETLSKGYIPMELFPVSQLTNMTKAAINMVRKTHPDYVLAISKITHYYDMKLVTFAVDKEGDLVVVFPTFVQSYNKRPLSLYEIETAKVPILDKILKLTATLKYRYPNHTLPSIMIIIFNSESRN